MFEMRRRLFPFLPQGLNRVAVWRVGWQLGKRQPLGVRREKPWHRLARVLASSSLHHDHLVGRWSQDSEHKRLVALGVATPRGGFGEQVPGNRVTKTTDVGRLAVAAGRPLRLLACGRPRVAQRAPRGTTGLSANEHQGLALLGLAEHRGPSGVTPLEAFGRMEVSGDHTGLRIRQAPILEEWRDRVGMVRSPKVPLDELLHPRRVPAPRGRANLWWARLNPRGELLAWGLGALAGLPWRSLVYQAGQAFAELLLAVLTHGLLPAPEPLSHVADAVALRQGEEGREAFDQLQRTAGLGLLETPIALLAGEGAQV